MTPNANFKTGFICGEFLNMLFFYIFKKTDIVVFVCFFSRYVFGKPVRGKVSINMNLHGLGYYSEYIGQNNYMFMDVSNNVLS